DGFRAVTASNGTEAMELVRRHRPRAVVTDLKMPNMSGIELLENIRSADPDLPVILMTAYATVDTAVAAMKQGAFDYVQKPFEAKHLVAVVRRAVEHFALRTENAVLKRDVERQKAQLIGQSPPMMRIKEQIDQIAESEGTVLISGESGTGKEIVAQTVHALSRRVSGPLLCLNCAALSPSLLESELFGHEKGAFTGAEQVRKGRFELAEGGTLLLDEVSEVPPETQAKLLRVLQERQFERVGSSMTLSVDVRIIATTNRNLAEAVSAGQFRQDLFYRLNVLPIHLPPLRQRGEDVLDLAEHFLAGAARRDGHGHKVFDDEAKKLLVEYAWPGNVRELENICQRAAVLTDGPTIAAGTIRPWLFAQAASALSAEGRTLEELEREAIIQTLGRFNGHRQRTAQALGIGVRTLGLKLKKWKEKKLVASSL
ncbi:MAG: sigma-54 dependent transcriptional regulator, partial [Phycisphaeraceae bacterium]|nr:sigma-54 dependent transcriptional regulator [Phycisphaeraceae bacterium]